MEIEKSNIGSNNHSYNILNMLKLLKLSNNWMILFLIICFFFCYIYIQGLGILTYNFKLFIEQNIYCINLIFCFIFRAHLKYNLFLTNKD